MTKSFEIWSEGYSCTGEFSTAQIHGISSGKNFKEACITFAMSDSDFREFFDKDEMTYWGCKLFDNENDARKTFG